MPLKPVPLKSSRGPVPSPARCGATPTSGSRCRGARGCSSSCTPRCTGSGCTTCCRWWNPICGCR
ncbi:hypothetical protein NKH77_35260 [Streptomyces sp. M19]